MRRYPTTRGRVTVLASCAALAMSLAACQPEGSASRVTGDAPAACKYGVPSNSSWGREHCDNFLIDGSRNSNSGGVVKHVDMNVARQAYAAAVADKASAQIMLALFEAGYVESRFHNDLTATDHDSLGYLQQRPSQGWTNPTNVAHATRSFISAARAVLAANPHHHYTAGQLAQAV